MKYILNVIFLSIIIFFLTACISSKSLDFSFYDASKNNQYFLRSFQKKFEFKPNFILLETTDKNNMLFYKQLNELNKFTPMDIEEFKLIYIISKSYKNVPFGYHTSINTAKNLAKNLKGFRLSLLDSNGVIIKTSKKPMIKEEIMNAFNKHNK